MSETVSAPSATPAAATPKKKGAKAGSKKPKTAPSHPKVSEMVNNAITSLKERGGSSLQAIKKHIGAQYKVDVDKLSPFIKKYLKSAVVSGTLVQTKGKGATGSFKLSASGQKGKETGGPKKAKKEGSAAAKKPKSAAAKKPRKPKQKGEKKKPSAAKKSAAKKIAKPKSPKKIAPKKPKTAKPKKVKATPKKTASKKPAKK